MPLSSRVIGILVICGILNADAHKEDLGNNNISSNDDNIDTVNQNLKPGNLRNLGIFDNASSDKLLSSKRPCKDGDPTFTVGNVTYACKADFYRKGGICGTSDMSSDLRAKSEEHFMEWKDIKERMKRHDHHHDHGEKSTTTRRNLGGCGDCVDWSTTIITIPTYFHVVHAGTEGQQFTYASNPAYIQNQIKAINKGFRGEVNPAFAPNPSRSYPRYDIMDADTKIQFCLAGTTATDNFSWYYAQDDYAMMEALKKGGSESFNVYTHTNGGKLGYATFPDTQEYVDDAVVIMNQVMPGGTEARYNEGDTLTHEAGHWLGLDHTHGSGGCAGPGDYMNLAPPSANYASVKSCEASGSFGCNIDLNNCAGDGGKNPIHNFMSYSDDNCMDQFSPGQKIKMQQAWETYRHKVGYSELISLAADGFSCVMPGMPTSSPTSGAPSSLQPTSSPTTQPPTEVSVPPTLKPSPQPSTFKPSTQPSTAKPSAQPSTAKPSARPSTAKPSQRPSTRRPTRRPTLKPITKLS